jgi:hypothetical protein
LVAPVNGPVAPRSAWILIDDRNDGKTVPVAIDATIASELAEQNTAAGIQTWNRKYSFATLLDTQGTSRIKNLKVKVTRTDADHASIVQHPNHTVLSSLIYPDDDFFYVGNAGEIDNYRLLAARPSDYYIHEALVSDILNGVVSGYDGFADNFADNNTGAGGFPAYVQKAVMEPATFNLQPACYTATISANLTPRLKGALDMDLAGTKVIGISAGSCVSPTVSGCITLP